jgi:hypothetical protein
MQKSRSLLLATLLLIFCGSILANGATINGSGTGLASPQNTVTFSEILLSIGQPISSYLGLTFVPGAFWNPEPGFFATPSVGNYNCNVCVIDPVTLVFPSVVNAAAFQLITHPEDETTFTALLNGVPVESFTGTTSFSQLWYGFENVNFNAIEVNVAININGAFQMDNVEYNAATPEPGTLLLMGSGILGLTGVLRRKLMM